MAEQGATAPTATGLLVASVYLSGFLQGLVLVSFPASSTVLKAMHGFTDAQYGAHIMPVRVSRTGLNRLSRYIWQYFDKDRLGALRRIAVGPFPTSAFYASMGTYDAFSTCNTWTAEALYVAGLPVTTRGVLFASQVLDQVRQLGSAPSKRPAAKFGLNKPRE